MSTDRAHPGGRTPGAERRTTSKPAPNPLEEVLRDLTRERGLTLAEVVAAAGAWCNRATVYRVLDGSTADPQVSTLAAICKALDVRPQDVFERTGLWTRAQESVRHAELRAVWTAVACLPDAERVRITQVVRAMVEAAHAQRIAQAR